MPALDFRCLHVDTSEFVPFVKGAHFRVAKYHIFLVQAQVASLRDVGISLVLLDNLPFDRVDHIQVHEFLYILGKRSTAVFSFRAAKRTGVVVVPGFVRCID